VSAAAKLGGRCGGLALILRQYGDELLEFSFVLGAEKVETEQGQLAILRTIAQAKKRIARLESEIARPLNRRTARALAVAP